MKIKLPIDIKSLYFNIKNDNSLGHTATVASPLRKVSGDDHLDNILKIKSAEINVSNKPDLIPLLIQGSKTKVIIKNVFVFNKLTVNGIKIDTNYSFGCYIKEEVDPTKVQFGRLKLHYPSKFVYEDVNLNVNNREIYKIISKMLHEYAFIIRSFEYDFTTEIFNFDALIVGEKDIPYSKVFIIEKGTGNKFIGIFNESADDYDKEIISLRKKYGELVNPYNYLDYFSTMKNIAINEIENKLNHNVELISKQYPYSIFDFCYTEENIKKYGILRVTATNHKYFNLSSSQKIFMNYNKEITKVFLVTNVFELPMINEYTYDMLSNLEISINSIKYEEN